MEEITTELLQELLLKIETQDRLIGRWSVLLEDIANSTSPTDPMHLRIKGELLRIKDYDQRS